jgi:hypothetical protein
MGTSYESQLSIYCEHLDSGFVDVFPCAAQAIVAPAWSPDGSKIAYYASERSGGNDQGRLSLHILLFPAGEDQQIAGASERTRYGSENRGPPVWSAAGDRVFFEARYDGDPEGMQTYQATIGDPAPPVRVCPGVCTSSSVNSDKIYISDDGVFCMAIGTGEKQKTPLVDGPAGTPKISPSETAIAYTAGNGLYVKPLLREDCPAVRVADWAPDLDYCWVCDTTFTIAHRKHQAARTGTLSGSPAPSEPRGRGPKDEKDARDEKTATGSGAPEPRKKSLDPVLVLGIAAVSFVLGAAAGAGAVITCLKRRPAPPGSLT